ncbi:MAG: 4Fe-4S dicluster domain-containing protein, partial [Candidatus Poribacteria bacterium]|nr:4Fe-4S dicluster domain-containing protein [Candidatus Poribacteria bacterium]
MPSETPTRELPLVTNRDPFDFIDRAKLDKCTHCGFCLPTCPTYDQLGLEMDSPRGRLYLMNSVLEGRSKPDAQFQTHMYRCLECRACETACPSGVPFGVLMEQARAMFEEVHTRPDNEQQLMKLVYESLLPKQKRLDRFFSLMRFAQVTGLQKLARTLGITKLMGK